MNAITRAVLALTVLCAGNGAFADESMTRATMTKHQMLKDCMEKHKVLNVSQSKSAMKRACKDEMKKQHETGDMPQPPQDSPKN